MPKLNSRLVAIVWNYAPSRYNGTHLNILLKLAGLTCEDGYAFPRMKVLAQMCGVEERQVRYIVGQLKADKVLKVQRRKGRANHFYIQAEELLKLPLAVPPEEAETVTPEPAAEPQASGTAAVAHPATELDAQRFAEQLYKAMKKDLPDSQIPDDWQTSWPVVLQKLFDAGHSPELMMKVALFAIGHVGWASTLLEPRGAHGFVDGFDAIRKQFETQQRKAA